MFLLILTNILCPGVGILIIFFLENVKIPTLYPTSPLGLDIDRCIIALNALYIGVVPKDSHFQEQRAYSNLLDLVWGVGDFSVAEYYAYEKISKKK